MTIEKLQKMSIDDIKKYYEKNIEALYYDLDGEGGTILEYAVWWDCYELLIFLIDEIKADIFINDKNNETLLFLISPNGENALKFFNYLINKGLDINTINNDGDNVLHFYIGSISIDCPDKKNINFLENVIDCGVNIFHKNNNGETPLELAKKSITTRCSNDNRIVKLLSCHVPKMSCLSVHNHKPTNK